MTIKKITGFGLVALALLILPPSNTSVLKSQEQSLEVRVSSLERDVAVLLASRTERFAASGARYLEGESQILTDQLHEVVGEVALVAGRATIDLNMTIGSGKLAVGFLSRAAYYGNADPVDTGVTNTYKIIPISATKFVIESSDLTDTRTVKWRVKGE